MSEKVQVSIAEQLAALIYYDRAKEKSKEEVKEGEEKKPVTPWEELPEMIRKNGIKQAEKIFVAISKLNHMVVPFVAAEDQFRNRMGNVDKIQGSIEAFVQTLDKPKGVRGLFPCRELAMRIVDDNK